ncbi:hypothetical protein GQ53DRAFT_863530 [Thozetella sp. PMI_491]|nr:hypothetical protein GQ53DRAFT_863530 [Thozetella sp. PMI_491]
MASYAKAIFLIVLLSAIASVTADDNLARLTPFTAELIYQDQVWPYNLPTFEYTSAISTVNSQGTFSIPGYNLTAGPSSEETSDLKVDGWTALVSVTADISLANSDPSNPDHFWGDNVDKSQFFDVANIHISPPDSLRASLNSGAYRAGWSVCAALWPFGLVNDALKTASSQSDTAFDGSCSGILSEQCLQDMAAAVAENCTNLVAPDSCKLGIGLSGSPVAGSQTNNLPMGLLFTATSDPLLKGDKTAFDGINQWVFPMAVAWSHLSKTGGDPVSTEAHVSCIRANKVLKKLNVETNGVDFLNGGATLPLPGHSSLLTLTAAVITALALWM